MKKGLTSKNKKTLEYVGCDFNHLKKWFEFLFDKNMSWDNYGKWEIDHVIPCIRFDFTQLEDQQKCFNWSNMRPCWKLDNIIKGDKMIDSILQNHYAKLKEFTDINPLLTCHGNIDKGTN